MSVISYRALLLNLSRYGGNGMDEYKHNLAKLFCAFHTIHKRETLFIWTTVLPVTQPTCDRVILEKMSVMFDTLCYKVLLVNDLASERLWLRCVRPTPRDKATHSDGIH